jgi:hypothetical protein
MITGDHCKRLTEVQHLLLERLSEMDRQRQEHLKTLWENKK